MVPVRPMASVRHKDCLTLLLECGPCESGRERVGGGGGGGGGGRRKGRRRERKGGGEEIVIPPLLLNISLAAEEAEQNFNEDEGWEFVTLADQVKISLYSCSV